MSSYTDAPGSFRRIPGTIRHRVLEPLAWEVGCKGSGYWFWVPAGQTFDVSIPRPFRWAFDPLDPRFLKAAALHDEMLHYHRWPRTTAGAEFAEALRADGVGRWERLVMFLAVVLCRWR